jgi:hypothetical protein
MRAGLRLCIAALTAGLALGPAPLHAQAAPEASTNTPATDAIGPRELQNFSLQGTVTREAEAPPSRAVPPAATRSPPTARPAPATETRSVATGPAPAPPEQRAEAAVASRVQPTRISTNTPLARATPPSVPLSSSITVALPPVSASPGFEPGADSATGSLAPAHGLPLWPWSLAAIALGAGGAFLFWRKNGREAFAGGALTDPYVAPEAMPRPPRPAPPAPRAAPPAQPAPSGIVSTRLRPWIDINFQPTRCVVEEGQVTFEFEVELFNSGSTPAQDVLIEAAMVNASPEQDQDIGAFFSKPAGRGERIPHIQPLTRFPLRPKLVVPIDKLRLLDAGGRQVFVPLIAVNALYGWGRGQGQTAAVYLVGRETAGEKLAPFRIDLGRRVFRGLGTRILDLGVRD